MCDCSCFSNVTSFLFSEGTLGKKLGFLFGEVKYQVFPLMILDHHSDIFEVSIFGPKVIHLLLNKRACIDDSMLHKAISNKNISIIKLLIEKKADIPAQETIDYCDIEGLHFTQQSAPPFYSIIAKIITL